MSPPPTPPDSLLPVHPLAPARLADAGTEHERRLLASADGDPAPLPSAERWTALLAGARSERQGASPQDRGTHDAQRSATLPSPPSPRSAPPPPPSPVALRGWKPGLVGVIAAGAIGAWIASQKPALVEAPSSCESCGSDRVASQPLPDRAEADDVRVSASPSEDPGRDDPGRDDPGGAAASLPQRASGLVSRPAPSVTAERAPPGLAGDRRPSPARRALPSASARAVGPGAALSPAPAARSDLAAEVRAIDSIQALIGWGDAARAAREVARYRQRFPEGALALEADVLEVDVALARGEHGRARALARALLERPEARRYRARLEALAEGSNGAPAQMNERR